MILEKAEKLVNEYSMLSTGDNVVLGLSGGADSVCLLCVLLKMNLKLNLTAVHVHHGIRGEEADRDAEFARKLCEKKGVEFVLVKENVPALARERGLSEEEMGRIVRYEAFNRYAHIRGNAKIAVAHHTDDSAETIIHNLCRGSGIAGLTGMAPVNGNIIRPLLRCTRAEIEEFLANEGESFVTDSTNMEYEYTRNKIRGKVLPLLNSEINSESTAHIAAAGARLLEIKDFLDKESDAELTRIKKLDDGMLWKTADFESCHSAIRGDVMLKLLKMVSGNVKDFTAEHLESISLLFAGGVGKSINLPYGLIAERTYDGVVLRVFTEEQPEEFSYEIAPGSILELEKYGICVKIDKVDITEGGKRTVTDVTDGWITFADGENIKIPESGCIKWFDCDKITNAVTVRTRMAGDRIILYDDGRSKKLKDYLIDRKIPRRTRDNMILIADGTNVMWICGDRDSAGYRITKNTTNIMMIEIIGKVD